MSERTDNNTGDELTSGGEINKSFFEKKLFIWLCLILWVIFLALFFIGRDWGWYGEGYVIDNELWGNFGDFIGGAFGPFLTLVSIIIVAWTFREQQALQRTTNEMQKQLQRNSDSLQTRLQAEANAFQQKSHEETQKQSELQRFNDLFFELLDLYRSQVDMLTVRYPDNMDSTVSTSSTTVYSITSAGSGNVATGKTFFDRMMTEMHDEFKEYSTYMRARVSAKYAFSPVYKNHFTGLSSYFRTIYRIFDLIEHTELPAVERKKYVKIVRAQLSRSELFLIHYNALHPFGAPSVNYINKYSLTKHLYTLDHLEMKHHRSKFTGNNVKEKIDGMNIIFYQIWKTILRIYKGHIPDVENSLVPIGLSSRYLFNVRVSDIEIYLQMEIKNNGRNRNPELDGLRDLTHADIQILFEDFLRERLLGSSFDQYCQNDWLSLNSGIKTSGTNGNTIIWARVTAAATHRIRLTHPDWD